MEEKKLDGGGRMVGSKVSQIATIFQAMAPVKSELPEVMEIPKTPDSGVTIVRTESHVARFNNARALFEKLGSSDEKAKIKVPDLRSRSSSTNSSLGGDSPNRATRDPSPGTPTQVVRTTITPATNGLVKTNGTHETSKSALSNDTYAFVKPSPVKSKDNSSSPKVAGVRSVESAMAKSSPVVPSARTIANGVLLGEKPAKPEKPERRLNSRELIEKQKNWTAHFSKTRNSPRFNSDPNKPAEPTSPSPTAINKSASFNLPRSTRSPPPPHPSTPPPPPPTTPPATGLRTETPVSSPSPTPCTPTLR